VFGGFVSILTLLPGRVDFLGTMYSFGAMLSFTIAHISVTVLRYRRRDDELLFRGSPNLRFRGVDWPLFAILGALATGIAWLVVVVETPDTRYAGLAWLAVGFAVYALYRRRLGLRLAETVRAPALVIGPSLVAEYRTIVVPVVRSPESEDALIAAGRLAAERGATIVALHVLEIPLARPLQSSVGALEDRAGELLDDAQALLEEYGVRVVTRLVRARSAARAIVDEAVARNAELIVVGAPRSRRRVLSRTAERVLKLSPVRVLVTAGRRAA
jgi:APA family basic amino acid/polyamine antiporter